MAKAFALKAIETKYVPCTNSRPSRVKASTEGNSLTISWDSGLDPFENHARVAEAFAVKMGWTGRFFGGATKAGYVFVNCGGDDFLSAFSIAKA